MNPSLVNQLQSKLVVLPRVSDELESLNSAIQDNLVANKTVQKLFKYQFKGLVVCKQPTEVLEKVANETGSAENSSQGCLYIPAPYFDRIIVIKSVSDLSRSDATQTIINSCLHQLLSIKYVVTQANVRSPPEVHLFLCHPSKLTKSEKIAEIEKELTSGSRFPQIELRVDSFEESLLKQRVEKLISTSKLRHGMPSKIVQYYLDNSQDVSGYLIKTEEMKLLNSELSSLHDVDRVTEVLDFHFPDRRTKLQSIPHINQIEDNMLYCVTEEGELGRLCEYGSYMGEIQIFCQQLLRKLEEPTGILLKSFSQKHLESIINSGHIKPKEFQMDWVYLGSGKIVVFEVGLSEDPKNPWQTFQNKVSQSLTKHLPQMQLIMCSVWQLFHGSDKRLSPDYLKQILQVCIYCPQLKTESLAQMAQNIKSILAPGDKTASERKFGAILMTQKQNLLDYITFLVSDDTEKGLCLFKLDSNFELIPYDTTPQQTIFENSGKTEDKYIDYLSTLLIIASLNSVHTQGREASDSCALVVDQRYRRSFQKWLTRDKSTSASQTVNIDFQIVLSPQQHKILSDDYKTHLIITGQPGTGKTSLLLAKCKIMLENDSIEQILFIYDERKTHFRKLLDKFLKAMFHGILYSKLNIIGINNEYLKEPDNEKSLTTAVNSYFSRVKFLSIQLEKLLKLNSR